MKYKLLTTHDTSADATMRIGTGDKPISGEIRWKRYKSFDEWSVDSLSSDEGELVVSIPVQPPAGKVMYQVTLIDSMGNRHALTDEPVVIRFKGPVPRVVLLPHVLLMFAAMLFSTRTGLEALVNNPKGRNLAIQTTILLCAGGLIFGPIVQKYAFGAFWTGWPLGHDLTDTKTAFAVLFWVIALLRGRDRSRNRWWILLAAVVTLGIYLIPHSVLGSKIDYTKLD